MALEWQTAIIADALDHDPMPEPLLIMIELNASSLWPWTDWHCFMEALPASGLAQYLLDSPPSLLTRATEADWQTHGSLMKPQPLGAPLCTNCGKVGIPVHVL